MKTTHKCKYPECTGKTLKELNGYTLCGYYALECRVFMDYKEVERWSASKGTV
ncbi:hypothetical protein LCGC14_1360980 [marine sediment metagenome]|uniref:Uncharacterized protein n=1 Tax=marine sediment metagenome TaxID=412755 RepID=A0A0F9K886_9ZZZZ